jgi:hypothetical protein
VEKFHFAIKADAQFLSNPIDLWRRSPPVVIEQLQIWEKTTRINNIAEIDIRFLAVPKQNQQLEDIKTKLSKLLEQE